jgi:hypothetical protein
MSITIEQIREGLKSQGCVAVLWCIEDVHTVRPDLTDEQAMKVLEACVDDHDAEFGINWLVIETVADDMFPQPEEGE